MLNYGLNLSHCEQKPSDLSTTYTTGIYRSLSGTKTAETKFIFYSKLFMKLNK